MPGDRLALAVLVGREVELVGILQGGLEPADHVLRLVRHHVGGPEVVVDVDGETLRLEIADRPDRRLDDVVVAEEAADGARLGGRFDDHERGHRRQLKGNAARLSNTWCPTGTGYLPGERYRLRSAGWRVFGG
jgi:hypothetical protein